MCLRITDKAASEKIRKFIESKPNKRIKVYKELDYPEYDGEVVTFSFR
jgi:hypothetical protein